MRQENGKEAEKVEEAKQEADQAGCSGEMMTQLYFSWFPRYTATR